MALLPRRRKSDMALADRRPKPGKGAVPKRRQAGLRARATAAAKRVAPARMRTKETMVSESAFGMNGLGFRDVGYGFCLFDVIGVF